MRVPEAQRYFHVRGRLCEHSLERPAKGSGDIVDKRLKTMIKELGDAINNSLSDSEQIAEVISRIKAGGYDVFVVLEATIGFNKRDEQPASGKPALVSSRKGEPE